MIYAPKTRWFYDGFDIELSMDVDPDTGNIDHCFEVKQMVGDTLLGGFDSLTDAKKAVSNHWRITPREGVRV